MATNAKPWTSYADQLQLLQPRGMQEVWTRYLEALERLTPAKFGGNEDELHPTIGRMRDVTHL